MKHPHKITALILTTAMILPMATSFTGCSSTGGGIVLTEATTISPEEEASAAAEEFMKTLISRDYDSLNKISDPKSLEDRISEDEILSMVNEGHEQGAIDEDEAEMISNIFDFSDKEAGDIMTHRNDIRAVDATFSLREAIDYMLGQHNSRFPVYQDNIDNIRGILNLRDAVKYLHQHPEDGAKRVGSIAGILRTPIYVPETKDIDDLFRQMQKEKQQMVIVIDEYGQTSGIASMEDILEEIVGNIMDEYDIDEHHITATGNKNEFIVDGRAELSELTKVFGIRFEDERFETVNGFMMAAMDRVPQPGDKFSVEYEGFRFRILSVKDRQVSKVMMTRLPRTAPGKAETRQDAGKPAEEEKNSSKVT